MKKSGMNDFISSHQLANYQEYHRENPGEPGPGIWFEYAEALVKNNDCKSLLDYGCGNNPRFTDLPIKVFNFDPAVPKYQRQPKEADLVMCCDVLEHIEPTFVLNSIKRLQGLTKKLLFVSVSCEHSTKLLPDGSPWHVFVRPEVWWREKMKALGFEQQLHATDRNAYIGIFRR